MKQTERGVDERDARALVRAYLRDVTRTGQSVCVWLEEDVLRGADWDEIRRIRRAVEAHLDNLVEAGVVIPGLAAEGQGLIVHVRATDVPSYVRDTHPLWRAICDGDLDPTEARDAADRCVRAWARYWAERGARNADREA